MLESVIHNYFTNKNILSKSELVGAIMRDFPKLSSSSIGVYLSRLKKEGLLSSPARGLYSRSDKQVYKPNVNLSLKKQYNKIKQNFPFVEFCVWDTSWLHDFMLHQPFKSYRVVEVEKVAVEQVFQLLSEGHKGVYLNPSSEMFERYIGNETGDVIIVKPLVTEAPVQLIDKVTIPVIEKLLVDILCDVDLFAAQQSEVDYIYQAAFEQYEVNVLKLKRYASRRNKEKETTKILGYISAIK